MTVARALPEDPPEDLPEDLVVDLRQLALARQSADARFRLEIPCLQVRRGERLALVGPSGCGKSSLLDCLALLIRPSRLGGYGLRGRDGHWRQAGAALARGQLNRCARLRAALIGYVPQIGGLIPALSVERNITLARDISGGDGDVRGLLEHLGLIAHRRKKPDSLSVGERQRVAIGRALVHGPVLLLADEPTSALDVVSADRVLGLLVAEARQRGAAVVIATHDAERAERHGFIRVAHSQAESDGRVVSRFERAA